MRVNLTSREKKRRLPWTKMASMDSGQTAVPLPSLSNLRCLRWGVRDFEELGAGSSMGVGREDWAETQAGLFKCRSHWRS